MQPEIFDVKRSATQKLFTCFEELHHSLKDTGDALQFPFPPEVSAISPKISQGEHLHGYPWVLLDYPRYFNGETYFAYRCMCWFGHYFSTHFLLGGKYVSLAAGQFSALQELKGAGLTIGSSPWEHKVDEPHVVPINHVSSDAFATQADTHGFIKISWKIPLPDLEGFTTCARENYASVLRMLMHR